MVDVDLGEGEAALLGVLIGELGEDGGDGAAWRAPVGVEVDDDVGGGFEQGVQLRGLGDLLDLLRGLGDGRAVREYRLDGQRKSVCDERCAMQTEKVIAGDEPGCLGKKHTGAMRKMAIAARMT